MTVKSQSRGHETICKDNQWAYADGYSHEEGRPCKECGNKPFVLRINGRSADIDYCIVPIVKALNDAGMFTVASCCGHGKQPGVIILKDRREVFIMPDWESARKVNKLFPPIYNED